ncbi:hypothetical protein [Paraburkholderia sp. BL10I2N1]|nr:hypothetical protein [Paraburkholderia sp. BL10I2N1]TDN67468.1 hypothetical protein B0G77_0745 [Paraburkholderia sp. BL10I2N1]
MPELTWYWMIFGGMLGSAVMFLLVIMGLIGLLWEASAQIAHDDHE